MVLPRIRLILVLGAVAAIAGATIALAATGGGATGGATGGGATHGGATGGGATHGGSAAAGQATVPSVRAVPPTCYVAGQTCSIHPCVEFVAPRLGMAQSQPRARARLACNPYPIPRGEASRIRR